MLINNKNEDHLMRVKPFFRYKIYNTVYCEYLHTVNYSFLDLDKKECLPSLMWLKSDKIFIGYSSSIRFILLS